jgi:TRAP-type C4-dicarboxylate transport system substrate-binding protein
MTVKIASIAPARSPWDIEQKNLAQQWSRITNGEVTLQFYDSLAQGGEASVIQKMRAVRPGQKPPLDGAIFTNIGLYNLAPASHVMNLCVPFLFRNTDEAEYILNKFSGDMSAGIADKGYVLLGWFNVGWIYFATKEPAETPEKLKSLRLALGGADSVDLVAAFKIAGFRVEDVASDKLSQSIKSPGGVQGVYAVPMFTYATKMHETLRYILDVPICPVIAAFVVSKSTWDAIPEKYRGSLVEEVHRSEQKFTVVQRTSDAEYLELMEKSGSTRVKLNSAQLAHWEQVLSEDAKRMAGTENAIINREFLDKIQAALDEYRRDHPAGR